MMHAGVQIFLIGVHRHNPSNALAMFDAAQILPRGKAGFCLWF
jgi:hypothetical protein